MKKVMTHGPSSLTIKERGLQGTELIISDAHKGLVSAIRKSFTNASWQRCWVHFLEASSVPFQKNSKPFREAVKAIFKFTDIELARTAKNALVGEYIDQSRYAKSLQKHWIMASKKPISIYGYRKWSQSAKSTNLLERLNQEVRRRKRLFGFFPNRTSANRLIGAVLMELLHDEWLQFYKKIY